MITQKNIEEIKEQIRQIHEVSDPTVCMIVDQNPEKKCIVNYELYKNEDGKFKMRLIGISLEDKHADKDIKNGTIDQVFEKLNLK